MTTTTELNPQLLDILRCPVAVHYTDKGDDPGKLELVRDHWLVCEDSGYKYPIIDGIPKMLIEEGAKWKDTAPEDLPVPPPNEPVYASAEEALTPEMQQIAADLASTADHTRAEAADKLQATARQVREQAAETEGTNEVLRQRAEAIASGLDDAAQAVNGKVPAVPVQPGAGRNGMNWWVIGLMFALGLVVGLLLRRGD